MTSSPRPGSLGARLFALFLIVPILELALLIWIGGRIGIWPTIGLIAATAVVGAWLAQREGMAVWRRFTSRLASGQVPGREVTDGLIILVSAGFLLTPGILTDIAGFLGLFPVSRAAIRNILSRRLTRGIESGSFRLFRFGATSPEPSSPADVEYPDEEIIDVPFEEFERPRGPRR